MLDIGKGNNKETTFGLVWSIHEQTYRHTFVPLTHFSKSHKSRRRLQTVSIITPLSESSLWTDFLTLFRPLLKTVSFSSFFFFIFGGKNCFFFASRDDVKLIAISVWSQKGPNYHSEEGRKEAGIRPVLVRALRRGVHVHGVVLREN